MNTDKRGNDINEYFERQEKEIQDYRNGDEETRQKLWTGYIFQLLQNQRWASQTHDPELIDFADFRKNNYFGEENPDKYLPGVIEALYGLYDENVLENIFLLDEQVKKYLEIQTNLDSNSQSVGNVIDGDNVKKNKTSKIEGVDLSNEELTEKIGDLFYDSLSSFLSSLGEEIDNREISELLIKASNHIMTAWKICLPYVSHDFPEMKHTSEIKGVNISKEDLAIKIGNLTNESLKEFLELLSNKIHKDGLADEKRGRKKLANELFETSKLLKDASLLLE